MAMIWHLQLNKIFTWRL